MTANATWDAGRSELNIVISCRLTDVVNEASGLLSWPSSAEGMMGKDGTLRFRMLSPFPVAGWKRGEGETESDESGLSVPPPRVSTSSMVDCPARFIRQIGRGREGAGNSEQLQDHRRAVLSGEGRRSSSRGGSPKSLRRSTATTVAATRVSRLCRSNCAYSYRTYTR